MKRTSALLSAFAAIGLSLTSAGTALAEVVEYEGWLHGEQADEALEQAQKYNVPVVIIKQFRETTCPLCLGSGRTMASAKPTKEMVRIIYYVGENSAGLNSEKTQALFNKVQRQVVDPSNWAPDLYFTTADGQALGFAPYEEPQEATEEGKTILQVREWIDSVPAETAKADREAERGRYVQAMEKIDEIMEQDAKISHLIQVQIGKAKKEDKMPATPVTPFFAELRDKKISEYQAMAQVELDAARQLVNDDKLAEARKALLPLSKGPEAFTTTADAKKLLDEVTQKLRSTDAGR